MNFPKKYQSLKPIEPKIMEVVHLGPSISELGLYYGKAGVLLGLYTFRNTSSANDREAIDRVINLIQTELSEFVDPNDLSFDRGVVGITWAIAKLYEQGHIVENMTAVINQIDDELYKLILFQKAKNNSLETGTIGRILYYLLRISDKEKFINKYRYITNYEVLILLVDDFTCENKKLIDEFKQQSIDTVEVLASRAAKNCSVVILLQSLEVKLIHTEIVVSQKVELLSIFLEILEKLEVLPVERWKPSIYWDALSIATCVTSIIGNHENDANHIWMTTSLLARIAKTSNDFKPSSAKQFMLQLWFQSLAGHKEVSPQLISEIAKIKITSKTCGINGFSGITYLLYGLQEVQDCHADFQFMCFIR